MLGLLEVLGLPESLEVLRLLVALGLLWSLEVLGLLCLLLIKFIMCVERDLVPLYTFSAFYLA